VFQSTLQRTVDALHALLPVVQDESPKAMETGGKSSQVSFMPIGHCCRFLEFLRVVS
jgi:hypothetical protein